jgi:putative hemolysin
MELENTIDIKELIRSKNPRLAKFLPFFVLNYLKRVLHQKEINQFIKDYNHLHNQEFCSKLLDNLNIKVDIQGIENIPKTGPVIIAMNHPLGGVDAVALISGLEEHRRDLKFIVNDLLLNIPFLKNMFVGVNKFGKNKITVRQQISEAFNADHAICIFPSGKVSRKVKGKIEDLEWKRTFVVYARELNRDIIPIFIDGELSKFFYRLSNFREFIGIKSNIEMFYLADELHKQKNKTFNFTVGKPINVSKEYSTLSDNEATLKIREKLYALKKEV